MVLKYKRQRDIKLLFLTKKKSEPSCLNSLTKWVKHYSSRHFKWLRFLLQVLLFSPPLSKNDAAQLMLMHNQTGALRTSTQNLLLTKREVWWRHSPATNKPSLKTLKNAQASSKTVVLTTWWCNWLQLWPKYRTNNTCLTELRWDNVICGKHTEKMRKRGYDNSSHWRHLKCIYKQLLSKAVKFMQTEKGVAMGHTLNLWLFISRNCHFLYFIYIQILTGEGWGPLYKQTYIMKI